jgi:DNA-binding PadR family transcriptional regulator
MQRNPTPDETILGMLSARNQHGYELLEHFRSKAELGRVWTMSTSQVYAVLKRLEKQGLIAGHEVTSVDAPPRTEYAITAAGSQHLDKWLYATDPAPSIRRVRVEFISKLYVADLLDLPIEPIVALQMAACQEQRDRLLDLQAKAESVTESLAIEFMIGQMDTALHWLDVCGQQFQAHRKHLERLD